MYGFVAIFAPIAATLLIACATASSSDAGAKRIHFLCKAV
jgi:hypothetical protein